MTLDDHPKKDPRRSVGAGPQGTKVFRRADIEQPQAEHDSERNRSSSQNSRALFLGVTGTFKGKRFPISTGRSTLGRDLTNDIVVDTETVSLVHARIIEKNGQWRVMNLLSTNGTWVNSKKVSDSVLKDGDSICFGEVEFIFQQTETAAPRKFRDALRRWFGGG